MVGLPYDCLANPLGAVRLTFDKAISSGLNPSTSTGADWGAVDLFRQFLFDDGGLSQVPILNAASLKYLPTNSLVRFRGMIQDMMGNEVYIGAYKDGSTWRTNKFSDVCQIDMDMSPDMKFWERRLLYCVPVPGLNSWAEPLEALSIQQRNYASQQREKRPRDVDEADDHMELEGSNQEGWDSPIIKKMREEAHPSSSVMQQDMVKEGTTPSFNPPDSKIDSFPCLIKVYDSPESDLKLNEVFEFIGVLNYDPELPSNNDESYMQSNDLEDDLVQLPSCKVPRIHCLVHKKIVAHDFVDAPVTESNPSMIRGIREGLLSHLTSVLGNDGVAAQYLLLHLLSQVHARVDGVAVGKFSLNFINFNKETASVFSSRLGLTMKELLPFTKQMPLTIDYLNSASLAPKKDYQANKLVSGALQLAQGSHLIIDETQLQAGTLNPTGVENARSLKNLTETQQVEYDFQYYKMEMKADVQLLILSEGKSNILPADLVLPFQPSSTGSSEIVDEAVLQTWRWYLAFLRSLSHSISPEMQKVVEEDLVAARQADRSLGSQDFSRLLTMSRLMSLSFGETSLSMEHWQMVKELERLRKERVK